MKEIDRKILELFEVGDEVVITKEIFSWSSILNKNYHRQCNIEYPYRLKIKEIIYKDFFVSMTEGRFGWNLSGLVEEGAIDINQFKRLKRLNKLKRLEDV